MVYSLDHRLYINVEIYGQGHLAHLQEESYAVCGVHSLDFGFTYAFVNLICSSKREMEENKKNSSLQSLRTLCFL